MTRMPSFRAVLAIVGVTCTLTGSAFGYATGRIFTVRTGDGADFPLRSGRWSCNNSGTTVSCFSGDAFPNVELTGSRLGGVTVKVHTLPGPPLPSQSFVDNSTRISRLPFS